MLLWLRHVLDAEAQSRGCARIFVSFDELLSDWYGLSERIGAALDVAWPRLSPSTALSVGDFIQPELRHHISPANGIRRDGVTAPWVVEVFEIFSRWTRHGEQAEDFAALERVASALNDAAPVFACPLIKVRQAQAKLSELQSEQVNLTGERDAQRAIIEALNAERNTLAADLAAKNDRIDMLETLAPRCKQKMRPCLGSFDIN